MTKDVFDALLILEKASYEVDYGVWVGETPKRTARQFLCNAIQHIARPERDTYPKTRRGTKGAPIVRR